MYAVVQCPTCRWARGVRAQAKSSTCPRCSRRFSLDGLIFLARAENTHHLAEDVARVNASSPPGGIVAPAAGGGRAVDPPSRSRERASVREMARAALLTAAEKEITGESMRSVLASKGLDESIWRRELDRLLAENLLYEPRPGRFRRS